MLTTPKSTEMFEPPTQGIMDPANLLTLKPKYKNSFTIHLDDLISDSEWNLEKIICSRSDISVTLPTQWCQLISVSLWRASLFRRFGDAIDEKIQPWQRRNEILENLNYNYFWRSQNLVSSRLQDESVFS